MRIANKVMMASMMLLAAGACRADTLPIASPAGAAPAVAAPAVVAPAVVTPQTAPVAALPPVPAGMPAGTESLEKTVSSLDDKVADSGHAMLRRLAASSDGLNFEELNSARQTVARIDAMIEIEKHLGDLEKLRNDRTGASASGALATAIPASALTPVMHAPPAVMTRTAAMPAAVMLAHEEVLRVSGSDGKYAAVLKMPDGSTRTVTPGSELSRGSRVAWITPAAVGIEDGGKLRTLHVKNVEMVYSAFR